MYPGLDLHGARLDRLPLRLKAALAAACTQRQVEAYGAYVRRTGGGDVEALNDLLNRIWRDIICDRRPTEQDYREREASGQRLLKPVIEDLTIPDDAYGPAAEVAILSLLYSNDVVAKGQTQDAIYASNQAFNSIDDFLTNPIGKTPQIGLDRPDNVERVFAHRLSQTEHRRQEQDLFDVEQAARHPEMIPAVVDGLRRRSAMEAKDFLPIIDAPTG